MAERRDYNGQAKCVQEPMKQQLFAERETTMNEIGITLPYGSVASFDMSGTTRGFTISKMAFRWPNFGRDSKVIGKKRGWSR